MDTENPRAVIGGNEPPVFERLNLRKEELESSAAKWLTDHPFDVNLRDMDKVQQKIDDLSNFKVQLATFWKETDGQRKIEKKPHDDAAQAVQDKYNPVLEAIKKRGDAVVARLGQWMTHLSGLREVARRQAEEEARKKQEAADKAKRDAEELARKAEAGELKGSGVDVFAQQERAEQAQAEAKAQEKAAKNLTGTVKGGTGVVDGRKRTVGMRTYYSAQIDNHKALMNWAFHTKVPYFFDALQQIADAAVRLDHDNPPPGVTVLETKRPA